MARRFRKIETYMWRSPKVRRLDADTKLCWAYLLSCPHQVLCPGLIVASDIMIAEDLFADPDAVQSTAEETVKNLVRVQSSLDLLQSKGFIKIDRGARVIVVLRAVSHNLPDNPNVVRGWISALGEVPACELRAEWLRGAHAQMTEAFGATDAKVKVLTDALEGKQKDSPLEPPGDGPTSNEVGDAERPDLSNDQEADELSATARASASFGDAEKLVAFMEAEIKKENPQWKVKYNHKIWVRDMDRLLRLDGRTPREVAEIIRWAAQHDFWSSNILSPTKLRKQYDQLLIQKSRNGKGPKQGADKGEYKHGKSLRQEVENAK